MRPTGEFMSEEFVQYAAECRRLARLARPPAPRRSHNPAQSWYAWLEQVRQRVEALSPRGHQPRRAAAAMRRSP